ncbi:serine/threonine-protein kinase RsbW [Microbacterium sp. SLBN-154]|uniref:ATP-binding protein n=1 Tax=Microbacterium sp. SLBN-154 TaxID=2768458 RepID=UPI001154A5E9|nr:ATP-binding protein [Microbacterium sp. SLBN-154]TQK18244.1 serine/threonine-protein kinase RsbW [Microbacterium sp. SLBN-154]
MSVDGLRVEGRADDTFLDEVHQVLDLLWSGRPEVDEEDRTLFTLAVSEIATNIVEHARAREEISVSLDVSIDDTGLRAVFADDAQPALIDLATVSMPGEDAESGRGLALALATLDELEHSGEGGNVWRLTRRLHRGS